MLDRNKIKTLACRVMEFAESSPNKLAVAFKQDRLTYEQLAGKAWGIRSQLAELGVQPGDRVAFSAVSKPAMVAAYLGIQLCGAVAVFLDKNALPRNMLEVCELSGSRLLLTDKALHADQEWLTVCSLNRLYEMADDKAEGSHAIPEAGGEDLSELLFTTGTTGRPKGVMLSHSNVLHIMRNTAEGIGIREDEVLLLPLPLNHSFALRVLRAVLYQGATVILQNGFTFARAVEENIATFGCTAMACVPASYEVIKGQMQERFGKILGGLRFIEFGAGSLSVRQRKEITALLPGVTIYNTWGSSETGGAIFFNVTEAVHGGHPDMLGRPLAGRVDVKIVGSDGNSMESDAVHPGRMALRGGMVMEGYWKDAETTEKTLVDGWILTGDMAYIEDGCVFMLGRADDIINVGGEKVSPLEVENVAGQYSGILECACVGVEDEAGLLGQVPVLFVVAANGYNEEGLIKYLSQNMERYKLPQKYIRLDELPRNRMQKVDRRALKEYAEKGGHGGADILNPVVEAILRRRSVRNFTYREIPPEQLDMILRCGYHAPSGHNLQSWRFTVLTRSEDIGKLKEVTKAAAQQRNVIVYGFENPKALVLVSNDARNQDGCQDASCAAENMMLAAYSYGIGSVWLNPLMTLRDVEPAKSLLDSYGIPPGHVVWAMVALGYPYAEGQKLRKKEDVVSFVNK